MMRLENKQKLTDRIWYRGKSYKLILPWMLQHERGEEIFEIYIIIDHLNNIDDDIEYYSIAHKLSGFTLDGQYITVVDAIMLEEDIPKFFLVAGEVKMTKYEAIFEGSYIVDITDYCRYYPSFGESEIEAAYNVDCKCFCTLDLKRYMTAFFWRLSTNPDTILIKDLRKELSCLKDMSITIKNGSLLIINEDQIQFVGTREDEQGYSTTTVITYDFSLGAIVSVEDAREAINKQEAV